MVDFASDVAATHTLLQSVVEPTPLQRNQYLSDLYEADIWLKREDLTPVRSYKVRGAYSFLTKALAQKPDQDLFVCSSAGNHAQAEDHENQGLRRTVCRNPAVWRRL